MAPYMPFCAAAFANLAGVSAVQLIQHNHAVGAAAPYSGCSIQDSAAFEQKLYLNNGVQDLAEGRICDTFEAAGGFDQVSFLNNINFTDDVNDTEVAIGTGVTDEEEEGWNPEDRIRRVVWVAGYPRSGSSTALSLVSATVDDNVNRRGKTFSVFEPCHDGDEYASWLEKEDCSEVLEKIAKCNFHGIKNLWAWADPHTTTDEKPYNQELAHEMCVQSKVVAFKTVDYGHDLKAFQWFLDKLPKLRILDVVRDPRGIYASWKVLEPFATLVKQGDFYTIPQVCDSFAENLDLNDTRIHRVVFEDLLDQPFNTTQAAYKFLGMQFNEVQEHWIQHVFHATWCPPVDESMEGFTDCHIDAGGNKQKWREVLTDQEEKTFSENANCQKVAKAYGWPLA